MWTSDISKVEKVQQSRWYPTECTCTNLQFKKLATIETSDPHESTVSVENPIRYSIEFILQESSCYCNNIYSTNFAAY